MKKIIFYLLLLLNFLLPLAVVTNSMDGDLGWHLRFGQELHDGSFPYLDTYTYSKFGMPWTNHEWGGDWLFWLIYSKLGYWWLNLLISIAILSAFLIIGKTFYKKIDSVFLFFSLICQLSVTHIYVTRLAMLTPLFAAITFFVIEKSKQNQRWLYSVPPLFWLWSILHGSWILGFIILNLYFVAALIVKFLPKKYLTYLNECKLPNSLLYKILIIQIISAGLITINPYGIKIWQEIIQYFGQNYYKLHTTEWLPSYTFPIFWKILIIQTIALVFAVYGFFKRKIGFTHLLIFLAFFYTAINYKRQAIFIGLLSTIILANVFEHARIELNNINYFNDKIIKRNFYFFAVAILSLLSLNYLNNIYFVKDVWADKVLTKNNSFPFGAVKWLKEKDSGKIKIFNSFSWGAYLNWTMPSALVYFDGRGTATWMYDKNKTMLEHYYEIIYDQNGLKEIEQDKADYVFLRQTKFIPMSKPDGVNNWIFGTKASSFSYSDKTQLEKDLEVSSNWKIVYSDYQVNIWENINRAPR